MFPNINFKNIEVFKSLESNNLRFDNPHLQSISNVNVVPSTTPMSIFVTVYTDESDSLNIEELTVLDDFNILDYLNVYVCEMNTETDVDIKRVNSRTLHSFVDAGLVSRFEKRLLYVDNYEIVTHFDFSFHHRIQPMFMKLVCFVDLDYQKISDDFNLDLSDMEAVSIENLTHKSITVFKGGSLQLNEKILDSRSFDFSLNVDKFKPFFDLDIEEKNDRYYGDYFNQPQRSFTSNNYITSDETNSSMFCFSLAYKDILKKMGRFGFLLRDDVDASILEEVYLLSPIVNLTVKRVRVQQLMGYNSVGSKTLNNYSYFDNESYNKTVVSFGEKRFKTPSRNLPNFRELNISNKDFRLFTCKDSGMSQIKSGEYIYKLNFTIKDGTIDFLTNQYMSLLLIERIIKEMAFEADRKGNYDKRGYFTDFFKKSVTEIFAKNNIEKEYLSLKIVDCMSLLFNIDENLYQAINSSLSVETGSVRSVDMVLQLVNRVLYEYEKLLPSKAKSGKTFAKTKSPAVIEIEEDLVGIFNTKRERSGAIDYINQLGPDKESTGLLEVSELQYKLRVEEEISGYFTDINFQGSIDIGGNLQEFGNIEENSYGFFTPKIFLVDNNTYYTEEASSETYFTIEKNISDVGDYPLVGKKLIDAGFFEGSENESLRANSTGEQADYEVIEDPSIDTIMEKYSVSTTTTNPIKNRVFNIAQEVSPNSNTNPLISSRARLADEPIQVQAAYTQTDYPEIVAQLGFGEAQIFDESAYKFNYQMISKIEYLYGYEYNTVNDIIIKKEIWKTLFKSVFDELKGEVLCRVIDYDSPLLFNRNTVEPNVNNRFFILKKTEQPMMKKTNRQILLGVMS